jgi:hypothetical protein
MKVLKVLLEVLYSLEEVVAEMVECLDLGRVVVCDSPRGRGRRPRIDMLLEIERADVLETRRKPDTIYESNEELWIPFMIPFVI